MPYSITCSTKIPTLAITPFLLGLSVNLLWCQVCTFYWPLRKKRFIILPKGTCVHIQQHIHQKDLNLCLDHVTMPRLLLNLKKHKQELWLYIYDFWFYDKSDFKSSLTPWRWIKNLSGKTTKYILRNVEKDL